MYPSSLLYAWTILCENHLVRCCSHKFKHTHGSAELNPSPRPLTPFSFPDSKVLKKPHTLSVYLTIHRVNYYWLETGHSFKKDINRTCSNNFLLGGCGKVILHQCVCMCVCVCVQVVSRIDTHTGQSHVSHIIRGFLKLEMIIPYNYPPPPPQYRQWSIQ